MRRKPEFKELIYLNISRKYPDIPLNIFSEIVDG